MKLFVPALFFFITYPGFSQTNTGDTAIQGVLVGFSYSTSIFPPGWQPAPINANAERNRTFYPYPLTERSNNTNTPSDPAG